MRFENKFKLNFGETGRDDNGRMELCSAWAVLCQHSDIEKAVVILLRIAHPLLYLILKAKKNRNS
jgi:hypothetical protein